MDKLFSYNWLLLIFAIFSKSEMDIDKMRQIAKFELGMADEEFLQAMQRAKELSE